MASSTFRVWIGIGGIPNGETATTHRLGNIFDGVMLVIAFWLPLQWYFSVKGMISPETALISDWLVWFAFVLETIVLTRLVRHKWRYLWTNWLNLLIIVVAFPVVWMHFPLIGALRALRVLIIMRLIFPWLSISRGFLARNHLGITLLVAVAMTFFSGLLLASFDPGIPSPIDGIWWAWETITTVGYGELVPQTLLGRILAIFVMLMGVALLSILTANFSAYLIGQEQKEQESCDQEILKKVEEISERLERLEQRLSDR